MIIAESVDLPDDELKHHGIKGQTWGDKNGPPYPLAPSDHSSAEKKAGWKKSLELVRAKVMKKPNRKSSDEDRNDSETQTSTVKKKRASDMTLDELKKEVERLQLIEKYESLSSAKQYELISRGKKIVADILEPSIKNIGTQTVTYVLGTAVNKLAAKSTGDAAIVNPKKGQKDK